MQKYLFQLQLEIAIQKLKSNIFTFISIIFAFLVLVSFIPINALAEDSSIYLGTISSISQTQCLADQNSLCEIAKVSMDAGTSSGQETVQLKIISDDIKDISNNYQVGDKIQIKKLNGQVGQTYFQAIAIDSGTKIIYIVIILVLFVVIIARWKGVQSVVALAITSWILFGALLPFFQKSPDQILFVGTLTCFLFLFLNLIVGHGWNIVSWLAFASSAISFIISVGVSILVVSAFRLNGLGSDGSIFLASSGFTSIQLANLFLIGTFLAVTGALDDVTSAQSIAIREIAIAKNGTTWLDLFRQGSKVGQEHLVSMINTLILAFVGATLPGFMVLYLQNQTQFWFILSREDVLEEIIRSVLASYTLILAIPLSTLLASLYFAKKYSVKKEDKLALSHL